MRLTERLLLEHLIDIDGDGVSDAYVLIEETRDITVDLEIDDVARFAAGVLHFAAIHPAFKEALLAILVDLEEERRAFARQTLADALAELEHAPALAAADAE